jgi:hypothetical protein
MSRQEHINIKYAAEDKTFIKYIRPIRVNKNSVAILPLGFWTAITENSYGFVLGFTGAYAEVFISNLGYKVKIKKELIEEIESLTESDSIIDNDTYFIVSDHKIGILCYTYEGKYHAYFPNIDEIIPVQQATPLSTN